MSSFVTTSYTSTYGAGCESKQYHMKQFLNAMRDYSQSRAEETANVLNRYLQLLGVTIDTSIFDPHTSIACEFYVSLHELLSCVDTKSTLAWCCVNVLTVACRNAAARQSLIHTYGFLPGLSRLLGDHLITDKKIRLLRLMQELTLGVKITWQIPHLPHLMATLTKWVECQDRDVVAASLAVLVNLCYKNLPAIYTLSRVVDTKQFVRTCSLFEGFKIEVHICKLLIILDHMNMDVSESTVLKLIAVTFNSVHEAFKVKDVVLLRHAVEFFADVRNQNNKVECFVKYCHYERDVDALLKVLETVRAEGDNHEYDAECIAAVIEFLRILVELKIPSLLNYHARIIDVTLRWVQTEAVRPHVLAIIKIIATQKNDNQPLVLERLVEAMPVFLPPTSDTTSCPMFTEQQRRSLSELMQLVKLLVQYETTSVRAVQELNETLLCNVFGAICSNDNEMSMSPPGMDTSSPEAINLYVHSLALVHELSKIDNNWHTFYRNLIQQRQLHMIMAQALYYSKEDIKLLILNMVSTETFLHSDIAKAMVQIQPVANVDTTCPTTANRPFHQGVELLPPLISNALDLKLDAVIAKVNDCCEPNNGTNPSMSDVLELYEYKMAGMAQEERATLASMEAASERCVHLQHRVAQLTTELGRLHQMLFRLQQNKEDVDREKTSMQQHMKDVTVKLDAELGRKKVLALKMLEKERLWQVREAEFDASKVQLEREQEQLTEKYNDVVAVTHRLEKSLKKQEDLRENYKKQILQYERQLREMEDQLKEKTLQLAETTQELHQRTQIIENISKLTSRSN